MSSSALASCHFYKKRTTYTAGYHPKLYEADEGGNVVCDNPLYDEEVKEPIIDDGGIKRQETYNPANRLTAKNTAFWYGTNNTQMTNLGKGTVGTFGESKIGKTIFTNNGYVLASRSVKVVSDRIYFGFRTISSGKLDFTEYCSSKGTEQSIAGGLFCIVVSVPASHINVADDGTVTLK